MQKTPVAILTIATMFLAGISGYMHSVNLKLKKDFRELNRLKEEEFRQQVAREREFIKKDLDEKYRADMVSFEALAKRMELERQKTRQLQEEVKKLSSPAQGASGKERDE